MGHDLAPAHAPVLSADLALDLGSVWTRLADAHGALLYEEPTVVLCERDTRRPVRFGAEALGNALPHSGRLELVRPVAAGHLAHIELAASLLRHVVRSAGRRVRRRILVTTPLGTTPVQIRAMTQSLDRAGAHAVRFIEQPLASALGAWVAIEAPMGSMVVDVGGEVTNIAAIALGGVIVGEALPVGAESVGSALRRELLDRIGLVVDPDVTSAAARELVSFGPEGEATVDLVGRDRVDASARAVRVSQANVRVIAERTLQPVFDAAQRVIAKAPPDVANDLQTSGIVLAGGGALIEGFAQRLARSTGVPIHEFDEPERLAVRGAARCLAHLDDLDSALITARRR